MNESELEKIKDNYLKIQDELIQIAVLHLNILNNIPSVHASNYRIKNTDHLLEKIKRKYSETRKITVVNYHREITDLIGIRILHIFKDGWKEIDNYIRTNYELHETPKAYMRTGDENSRLENFECITHKFGYRSLHYLIKTKPRGNEYIVEIQVRTIFEEAWGEIDHSIRYPNISDYKILNKYSLILNRLAGLGDEMGINIRELKEEIDKNEISKLETKINKEQRKILNIKRTTSYYSAESILSELNKNEAKIIDLKDWNEYKKMHKDDNS